MTAVEKVDEVRNIEKLELKMDVPNVGYTDVIEYIDLESQVFTTVLPEIGFCEKYAIPFNMNFTYIFDQFSNPSSGIITYLGAQPVEWERNVTDYAFEMDSPLESLKDSNQILYFNQQTLQLEWAKLINKNIVVRVPNGQQAATFADDEFDLPSICDNVPINPFPQTTRAFM
jgi:hypothetical protein